MATAVNMMSSCTIRLELLHFHSARATPRIPSFSSSSPMTTATTFLSILRLHSERSHTKVATAALDKDSLVPSDEAEDGVLHGTMKLPSNTDIPRFQILLFQWANSLCQGANLSLDMPLKVELEWGSLQLGMGIIGYIDCLVFPPDGGSGPTFRAVRNGRLKDRTLPGEPRIMRNLMQALQKSVQIARLS